ncbi:hypothetical protein [Phyllobacterium endophyticum]|uniref:hypothetical protein n=1 Tax=Phyllobacterium endophyticum TaxID=1149773 RepID=UPI002484A694|nr:hypothetical protein [Phyllobacterium endophyticum]
MRRTSPRRSRTPSKKTSSQRAARPPATTLAISTTKSPSDHLPIKNRKPVQRDGFRSGLETANARVLNSAGVSFEYEKHRLFYIVPARVASYKPDFVLANGIILETKGLFDAEDRQHHILLKQQHPELVVRFVFSRSATTLTAVFKKDPTTGSKTRRENPITYAKWCETHGFEYADKVPPMAWLTEPFSQERWDAIERAKGKPEL